MKLSWSVSQRKSGRPFTAAEIERYELSMQVEGAPGFTQIPGPAASATQFTIDVTDPGTYRFRLVCVPKVGTTSDPAEGEAEILDTSAPVIAEFTVTV